MPLLWHEPYGGIFLDARAADKFVITTPKGGNPEALKGYDKVLYIDDILQEGGRVLDELKTDPGPVRRASSSRLDNLNSFDKYIDEYEAIYRSFK